MIHYPSRCTDHNLRPFGKGTDLPRNILPTINRHYFYFMHIFCKTADFLRCLHRQFPCGAKDNRLQPFFFRIYFLDNRYPESRCLSCSGLRLPNQILPFQHNGNRLLLNRGHRFKPHFFHCPDNPLVYRRAPVTYFLFHIV